MKLSNKEPTKCVYLSGDDAEGVPHVTEEAKRDEGAGVRKRYASTSRPPGIPTEVWENMGKVDKADSRLAEAADGKSGGIPADLPAASANAGGPPAAAVQHQIGDCAFGGEWPFPGANSRNTIRPAPVETRPANPRNPSGE